MLHVDQLEPRYTESGIISVFEFQDTLDYLKPELHHSEHHEHDIDAGTAEVNTTYLTNRIPSDV